MDCQEECGVFGIWAPGEPVCGICYTGIFALQHRGQEGAGIAYYSEDVLQINSDTGLVNDVFKDFDLTCRGTCAIGHVQYSKRGDRSKSNLLPISIKLPHWEVAISYNGQLTNAAALRDSLKEKGVLFQTSSDAEIILQLLSNAGSASLEEAVRSSLTMLEGSFSILLMTDHQLIAARDPYARKPLCFGTLKEGQFAVGSESCAIDTVNANFVRDLAPGEMILIDAAGLRSVTYGQAKQQRRCVFEYIYFARTDSVIDGIDVWAARHQMGKQLAQETQFDADVIVPVPSSGVTAAMGYSEQRGIPQVEGIVKNHYVGRTFILPYQEKREAAVHMKLSPIKANLKGKSIILVDDSIVRGTTMKHVISMLRQCEVKNIYLCMSSPQIIQPCKYGVDMATYEELIASHFCLEQIQEFLGCDGIHFLSLEGLLRSVHDEKHEVMCLECFGIS